MRIQSITSLDLWNNSTRKKQAPLYQQPNFEGKLTIAQVKKFPLEKKLSYMFDGITSSDLIAVGKNVEEVKVGIVKAIEEFGNIIKRVLFIKHGGIAVPMAFGMQEEDSITCTNIGNKDILITTGDEADTVEPNDTYFIDQGDVIINNKVNISIDMFGDFAEYVEDPEDMELVTHPENFATKVFDLTETQRNKIVNINKAAFATLMKEEAKENDNKTKVKKLTFADVGGMDKTIESLKRSVLYPIKYPFAFENVSLNRGILLYGKPGTGKTLLAESLAGECEAKFLKISGTDLESKWVGETEAKWRELFANAIENQPSIIFIDEFDSVVKERGRGANSGNSDKVVNQILSLMSDLEKSNDNVFVIATTNKPETIDSAIKRSGRFGKQIEIPLPDRNGLDAILEIHTRGKQLDSDIDRGSLLDSFVSRQFTGADIKHVVNEAHTNSWTRTGVYEKMDAGTLTPDDMVAVTITKEDFEHAIVDWDKHQTTKIRRKVGF